MSACAERIDDTTGLRMERSFAEVGRIGDSACAARWAGGCASAYRRYGVECVSGLFQGMAYPSSALCAVGSLH
jgi:hypothetical protein